MTLVTLEGYGTLNGSIKQHPLEKVTKTQVIVRVNQNKNGVMRFRRKDGHRIGDRDAWSGWMLAAADRKRYALGKEVKVKPAPKPKPKPKSAPEPPAEPDWWEIPRARDLKLVSRLHIKTKRGTIEIGLTHDGEGIQVRGVIPKDARLHGEWLHIRPEASNCVTIRLGRRDEL